MSDTNSTPDTSGLNRRDMIKTTSRVAAASALAGVAIPNHVYAAGDDVVQVAIVGCGGRGSGAMANALSTTSGPVKLVAMADAYKDRLDGAHRAVSTQFKEKVDVSDDRKFVGFDAYKNAMDSLKPGDVVILTTPPAFRWVHYTYAISKGLNVFMEKPVTVDGPSSRRMLELNEKAKAKNLKVGVGLMCRHCAARGELFNRIKDGQIGDLVLLRAYRVSGPTGSAFANKWDPTKHKTELEYQIRNFHAFLWASGGGFSDFLIHNIDECCWMKDAWPVEAKGYGGRHFRGDYVDQNFDSYTVEYTFADGTKLMLEGRGMPNCQTEFASYCHGTKGSAVISQSGHAPSKARTFKAQRFANDEISWQFGPNEPNPYQLEWDHLIDAIRNNKPYNEVERGVKASLVTAMGRMSCHTGKIVTYDDALNHEHELGVNKDTGVSVDKLTLDGPSPLVANADGRYPIPMPGITTKREF